jgi:two-component system LytT family response regulator
LIRALIVDDELLARDGVRLQLQNERDISIVGEAIDGPEAVAAINRLHPDLVFLDIQVPGYDGFEVLRRVSSVQLPAIIFITAYDCYAVRAFEARALDYLIKPLNDTRFQETLDRVRRILVRIEDRHHAHSRLLELIESRERLLETEQSTHYCHRFTVKHGSRFIVVNVDDIDWLGTASNYVELHVQGHEYLLRAALSDLEEKLDPLRFVRIHRSTVVNLERVVDIRPTWQGDFKVRLSNGTELRLSRVYRDRLLSPQ